MRAARTRPSRSRTGLTLVEMLVTMALLVLMMSILVQIFRSATGSITTHQTLEDLAQRLRKADQMLRSDLLGVTAKMTPPLNPRDNLGYFEYGENQLADYQGEDSDDYLAFTAKAPPGQPFVGRVWVPYTTTSGMVPTPAGGNTIGRFVTVTSDHAEIVYFLRGANLYRRVLLILPRRQATTQVEPVLTASGTWTMRPGGGFLSGELGMNVSWQAMNDLSAHPSPVPADWSNGNRYHVVDYIPTLNTLGHLTNRENRFARPRFADDYGQPSGGNWTSGNPDGHADDQNYDGLPDYYQTLYPNAIANGLVVESNPPANRLMTYDTLAFPFVFPGAFSKGRYNLGTQSWSPVVGSIHGMYPPHAALTLPNGTIVPAYPPLRPNHSPMVDSDNLPTPSTDLSTGLQQTWWGFPTWRETASPVWTDPIKKINDPSGALYFTSSGGGVLSQDQTYSQAPGLSWMNPVYLPSPLRYLSASTNNPPTSVVVDPFSDLATTLNGTLPAFYAPWLNSGVVPEAIWEEDLILTGVRSFDVKAYENSPGYWDPNNNAFFSMAAGYYDLGYADKDNQSGNYQYVYAPDLNLTLNHEGRIPPTSLDNRFDPQTGASLADNTSSTLRLLRVWDTWSTDYMYPPGAISPSSTSYYPAYPPPYPVPLRGVQVQIRLVDPDDEHIRTLTIRQDFTDKL